MKDCIYKLNGICELGHDLDCEECHQYAVPLNGDNASDALRDIINKINEFDFSDIIGDDN